MADLGKEFAAKIAPCPNSRSGNCSCKGFSGRADLLNSLGWSQGQWLVAWSTNVTAKSTPDLAESIKCLIAPWHPEGCDALLHQGSKGNGPMSVASHLSSNSDFDPDALYDLMVIPSYVVPLAQAVVLEAEALYDACAGNQRSALAKFGLNKLDALSPSLRSFLIDRHVVLRKSRNFIWRSPFTTEMRLKPAVQLLGGETCNNIQQPLHSWSKKQWSSWFRSQGIVIVCEMTKLELNFIQPSCKPSRANLDTIASLKSGMPSMSQSICRKSHWQSLAIVTGPHDDLAIAWLAQLYPGSVLTVLSAAVLSDECEMGKTQESVDIRRVREWILSKAESGVATVVVIKGVDKWFAERDTKHFGDVLRAVLDKLEWHASYAFQPDDQAKLPGVTLAFVFDSAPPKIWDGVALFDEVVFLDDILGSSRKSGIASDEFILRHTGLTLLDVHGCRAAKEWFNLALEAATRTSSGRDVRPVPCCVAFCGPSGCGKTSLLAAFSGSSRISVLPLVVPQLINAGVGDTPAAVRKHFADAEQLRPACVTLDDADMLFAHGGVHGHATDELLRELALMLDQYCSPRLLFVTTCTSHDRLPSALGVRVHSIELSVRVFNERD